MFTKPYASEASFRCQPRDVGAIGGKSSTEKRCPSPLRWPSSYFCLCSWEIFPICKANEVALWEDPSSFLLIVFRSRESKKLVDRLWCLQVHLFSSQRSILHTSAAASTHSCGITCLCHNTALNFFMFYHPESVFLIPHCQASQGWNISVAWQSI